jgi:hypothetical protein
MCDMLTLCVYICENDCMCLNSAMGVCVCMLCVIYAYFEKERMIILIILCKTHHEF